MQVKYLRLFKKMKKQNALTLIEILISTVVLSLVFLGLLNLFISGRRFLEHSQSRMGGGELGKVFMDPLQMQVRQSDWVDSGVTTGTGNQLQLGNTITSAQSLNGITYTATSAVYTVDAAGNLRGVQTSINWQETQQ